MGFHKYIESNKHDFTKFFGFDDKQIREFMDVMSTVATKKFTFDIIKFDDWLHDQEYTEEFDGSAFDYVIKTYGRDAAVFIRELI